MRMVRGVIIRVTVVERYFKTIILYLPGNDVSPQAYKFSIGVVAEASFHTSSPGLTPGPYVPL